MVPVSQRGSRQFREAHLAGFATRGHFSLVHSSSPKIGSTLLNELNVFNTTGNSAVFSYYEVIVMVMIGSLPGFIST